MSQTAPPSPPAAAVRVPGHAIDLERDELRTADGALVDLRRPATRSPVGSTEDEQLAAFES